MTTVVDKNDLDIVQAQTSASTEDATQALIKHRGDLVNAIVDLTNVPSPSPNCGSDCLHAVQTGSSKLVVITPTTSDTSEPPPITSVSLSERSSGSLHTVQTEISTNSADRINVVSSAVCAVGEPITACTLDAFHRSPQIDISTDVASPQLSAGLKRVKEIFGRPAAPSCGLSVHLEYRLHTSNTVNNSEISVELRTPDICMAWTVAGAAAHNYDAKYWRKIVRLGPKAEYILSFGDRRGDRYIGKVTILGDPEGYVSFLVDDSRGGVSGFTVPKDVCRSLFEHIASALEKLERTGLEQRRPMSPVW